MEPTGQAASPGAGTANGTLVSTGTSWPRWKSRWQIWAHRTAYPPIEQGGYARLIVSTRSERCMRHHPFHAVGAISFVIRCQAVHPNLLWLSRTLREKGYW